MVSCVESLTVLNAKSLMRRPKSYFDSFLNQDGGAINMKKHIIQVSTYQMCVLLLFNKKEKVTFEVSF